MQMTEKMIAELKEAVERQFGKDTAQIVEEALRNYLAIGTLPPASFPAGLVHDGDYYTDECPPKPPESPIGWNGDY